MSDGVNKRYINAVENLYLSAKRLSFYLSVLFHATVVVMLIFFYSDHGRRKSSLTEVSFLSSTEPQKENAGTGPVQTEEAKKIITNSPKIVHSNKQDQINNKITKQQIKFAGNADSTGNQTEGNNPSIGNSGNGPPGKGTAGNNNAANADYYYVAVDQMPVPVGGMQSILSRMNIPEKISNPSSIYILAFIDEYGIVQKCLLVKGIGNSIDQLAVSVVRKTKFQPGVLNGKRVKVQLYLSIPIPAR